MCVSPNRHDQRGLTLIELIMFIVIVSIAALEKIKRGEYPND